jgi:predicted nucleic acid-binding protein
VHAEFFVDTSAWYPLLVASHPDHAELAAVLRALIGRRRRLVTTNFVVAESHALLLRRASRSAALIFVRTVGAPPNVVVHASPELEKRAVRDGAQPPGAILVELAKALRVSTDESLGVKPVRETLSPKTARLLKRLRPVEELPPADQRAVLKVVDAMLETRRRSTPRPRRRKAT